MRTDQSGRGAWLEQGLALLQEQGAPAVTLERLCKRVGMSKGSFYHHFGSMPGYRVQLLSHYETEFTTAVIDAVEGSGPLPAGDRLSKLVEEASKGTSPALEIAVRAWAKQDPEAAAIQERVDAARIAYVRDLCEEAGYDGAEQVATLIYLVMIGSEHLMPPLPKAKLGGIYELLLPLLERSRSPQTAEAPR